ncbi:MAG TPA: insulinase family protein [Patescibacteria group bacterium]|nr:insulinase family protein [Patescibacteria group bacterium]
MRDRQVFEETRLSNGICTFHYKDQSPLCFIKVLFPVGSAHSCGMFPPGMFHFLEHMVMRRHPNSRDLDQLVGLKGGDFRAKTTMFHTIYSLEVPAKHFQEVLPKFFSFLFEEPPLPEEAIRSERGIISSERRSRERWFPGDEEIEQYLRTQWMCDFALSLRQQLGSEDDLDLIDAQQLRNAYQSYFHPSILVLAGGSVEPNPLFSRLETLKTHQTHLKNSYQRTSWANREYREHAFRDASRYVLNYGSIMKPCPELNVVFAIDFIMEYLTNGVHGPIYSWLREERGWVYEVTWNSAIDDHDPSLETDSEAAYEWHLFLPLANKNQVKETRKEFPERVKKALKNTSAIQREVERRLSIVEAYWYNQLKYIVEGAERSISTFGKIVAEAEYKKAFEACRNPAFLQQVWDLSFKEENIGSICTIPFKET